MILLGSILCLIAVVYAYFVAQCMADTVTITCEECGKRDTVIRTLYERWRQATGKTLCRICAYKHRKEIGARS